jgi:hypothetical protein
MSKPVAVALAIAGALLPYAVGIAGTTLLGKNIGDLDYYRSGQLARSDFWTGVLTLAAYAVGVACCIPALSLLLAGRGPTARLLLGLGLLLVAGAHLIAVFAVRFWHYYQSGGIL